MTRSETLLAILKLFLNEVSSIESISGKKGIRKSRQLLVEELELYRERVLMEGKKHEYYPDQIAILSTSRNQSALRIHSLLRLFVEFHLPRLFNHFMMIDDTWWYPRSYDIENEADFVTVLVVEWSHF